RGEVRFIPYQNDPNAVARYYQAADVYVHAARVDTFPMAVLEAMACGVPVVASAVGGIPEQFEDGHAGFLVRAGDREGFAARLAQLLASHTLRCRMGGQGAECVSRHFDLQRQVDTYLEWYRELIEHRDRGVAST